MRLTAMTGSVLLALVVAREGKAEATGRQLPEGLKEVAAMMVWTDGLAPGSEEAQKGQLESAREHGLPVEVEKTIGMRFRLIPPGEFRMGTLDSERDWDSHDVQPGQACCAAK